MRAPARSLALGLLWVAAVAWAQTPPTGGPSRVACGPGRIGCGPATGNAPTTTTTTTTTTTVATSTTLANASPSWVPSTLAAWMLDEAAGATRVNLQGTTSRNLADTGGVGSNTTNKMEGAAAADLPNAAVYLSSSDTTLQNLVSPLSVGCWVRPVLPSSFRFVMGRASSTNNILLDFDNGNWVFYIYSSAHSIQAPTAATLNAYTHVVGTYAEPAMNLYTNGVLATTGSSGVTLAASTFPWEISDPTWNFYGQVDECFVINMTLSAASVCRICSCGIRGEQCACSGAAFTVTGRNASACGSCTLPANCSATAPS